MAGITQKELAEKLNVSRSTVAAILSNTPKARISPAVREAVLEAAKKYGYVANRHAQIISGKKSGMIAILQFSLHAQLPQVKVFHAATTIRNAGYEPLITNGLAFENSGESICRHLSALRVEGVILVHPPLSFTQKDLDFLLKSNIPVVTLGGAHLRGITNFMSDKEQGFEILASHLFEAGHRHLVLMVSASEPATKKAFPWHQTNAARGFRKACAAYGQKGVLIEVPPGCVEEEVRDPYSPGYRGMEMVFKNGPLPDAVLCSNDDWALGALRACTERGVRVPGDLAVTGFENDPASGYGAVPLTTVEHPAKQMAEEGVSILISIIRGDALLEENLIILPCRLVIRRSCALKPTADVASQP